MKEERFDFVRSHGRRRGRDHFDNVDAHKQERDSRFRHFFRSRRHEREKD